MPSYKTKDHEAQKENAFGPVKSENCVTDQKPVLF